MDVNKEVEATDEDQYRFFINEEGNYVFDLCALEPQDIVILKKIEEKLPSISYENKVMLRGAMMLVVALWSNHSMDDVSLEEVLQSLYEAYCD